MIPYFYCPFAYDDRMNVPKPLSPAVQPPMPMPMPPMQFPQAAVPMPPMAPQQNIPMPNMQPAAPMFPMQPIAPMYQPMSMPMFPDMANMGNIGNIGNVVSPANAGNVGNVVSPANAGNVGNIVNPANAGNTGNVVSSANAGNPGNVVSPSNVGNIGNVVSPSNLGNIGNVVSPSNLGNIGNVVSPSNVGNIGNVANPGNIGNVGDISKKGDKGSAPSAVAGDPPPVLSNNPATASITLFKELTAYPNYGNPSGNADILYLGNRGTWTFDVPAHLLALGGQRGQLIIRAVLDDHADVPPNRYSARISINGIEVHNGRVPLEHGTPAGSRFNNWRQLTFDVRNLSRTNRVTIENTSSTGPNDWIGFDWMEMRLIPR